MIEDIGCHFKFEEIFGNCYHNTDLMLSSGRNCLRYIIKERNIKTLYLPYFLCESLSEVAKLENINVVYYHLDKDMLPVDINVENLNENCYLYFVNYYGLLREKINEMIKKYKFIIVDNTQDFFDDNVYNADVIYNYRKYFGVPDGACIVSPDLIYNDKYEKGQSAEKIREMVLRDETGEFFHYPSFYEADKYFKNEDLNYMSNFTNNYLKAIDYYKVLKKRIENYKQLAQNLNSLNKLDICGKELSYMYPLLVDNGTELRKYLDSNNIYSQLLWPNMQWNGANEEEVQLSKNMVLLPIDQRYSTKEMHHIINTIDNYHR